MRLPNVISAFIFSNSGLVAGSALMDYRAEVVAALAEGQKIESVDLSEIEEANDPFTLSLFRPRVDVGDAPWFSGFHQNLEIVMPVLTSVFTSEYDERVLYLIKVLNERPNWFTLQYLSISHMRDIPSDFLRQYKNPITEDINDLLMNIIRLAYSPEIETFYRTWSTQHELPEDMTSPDIFYQAFLEAVSVNGSGIEILPEIRLQISAALDASTIEDLLPRIFIQDRQLVEHIPVERWVYLDGFYPMYADESFFRLLSPGSNPRGALFLLKSFRDLGFDARRDFMRYTTRVAKGTELTFWMNRMRLGESVGQREDWEDSVGIFLTSLWDANRGNETHASKFRQCTDLPESEQVFDPVVFYDKLIHESPKSRIVNSVYRPLINAILKGDLVLPAEPSMEHSIAMTLLLARLTRSPAAYYGLLADSAGTATTSASAEHSGR